MKKFALTAIAATIALGSVAAPAFAKDANERTNVNTTVISAAGKSVTLDNGWTFDNALVPSGLKAGDRVTVIFDETNDLHSIRKQ